MRFVLIVLLFPSISLVAQETRQKRKGNETFYVLSGNPDVRQGEYIKTSRGHVVEKGQYENNQRVGLWEFYSVKDEVEQKYDYTRHRLIFDSGSPSPFSDFQIVINGNPTIDLLDTIPIFIGGSSRYLRFIRENLKYPPQAKRMGTEGRAMVVITIASDGMAKDGFVARGISTEIDQEALRLATSLSNECIPGRKDNRAVDTQMVVPVLFKLPD